jgi:16S rRNA (cytosine967-C5)-methyltransferase
MAKAFQESMPLWRQLQATAGVIAAVRKGSSGTAAVEAVDATLRPGVQALAFQVWRNLGRAQALRNQLVSRLPAPGTDALLCVALALAWNEEEAPYDAFTLVNQAVEALKRHPATAAHANFVNACLRRFLRERAALVAATDSKPEARWNHPLWWVERLQRDHPQHWQAILAHANSHPPMTLRVNVRKSTPADYLAHYLAQLQAAGIAAHAGQGGAVVLEQPVAVGQLPGFAQGCVSVQDAAAQMAAPLLLQGLGAHPHPRVLDACAAPGGKTAHVLEASDADVLAVELDARRMQRVAQTLERLGLQAQLRTADAAKPQDWWDGVPFDGILLDAPCTASGIVRRHPDVRWLRRASDIAQLARLQAQLLDALWPLLRPGGRMVYCTCSVFLAEGADQVRAFLARQPQALMLPAPGHLLPGHDGGLAKVGDNSSHAYDGFYYALLEKRLA